MIPLNELCEILPVYVYPKGYTVSFDAIQGFVSKVADDFNVPIAFVQNEIVSINLPKFVVEECLVIYHPDHQQDYFKIVIRINRDTDTAYIHKYIFGGNLRTNTGHNVTDTDKNKSGVRKIKRDKSDSENNYFAALKAIFEYVRC